MRGLRSAFRQVQDISSIGIDSWAVDYALLKKGRMLGVPYHYRDKRSAYGVNKVHSTISAQKLYQRNGLQHLDFNTLFQLSAEREDEVLNIADRMLMIPDLFNFWLTGQQWAESTNASTTGLVDANSGQWDLELIEKLELPTSVFPPIIQPGQRVGTLLQEVAVKLETSANLPVISVGSHDTASAVVAVPKQDEESAFISSGTWSLVGVELDAPVLSSQSQDANFTNERGVDGKTRFLKNVSGLWLLSESARAWGLESDGDLQRLLLAASEVEGTVPTFDVMDPSFTPPGDMPKRIRNWFEHRGAKPPSNPAELVRSILESLAEAYANTLDEAEKLSGVPIKTIHIVGGGSQNELLCQLTADRTGKTVLAGPVEATAMGNILVQLRAVGEITGGLAEMREIVSKTVNPRKYTPRRTPIARMSMESPRVS